MVKTSPSINEPWDTVCSLHNLTVAWARVKGNEGSSGVDRVTIAEFESNLEENLTDLAIRLDQGDYLPLPVLRTHIAKQDGGQRPIGIPAVRDRIVQQSLLSVLSPIFDRQFLDCSFAYRPGRSALDAIRRVEMLLTEGHKWVLDADIERFFETVDHELLLKFVAETILDQRILDLIQRFLKTGVFDNMSLREEYLGITQGSALSPLLANIYLHRFDRQMLEGNYHLIRYADDFLILEDSEERIGRAMADAALTLNNLKLSLSQKKTRLVAASAGFTFLGYHFDARGKGPSKKSAQAIQRRLDNARQADGRRSFDDRVEGLKQIIRGWSGYFGSCRGIEPEDIFTLIATLEISLEIEDYENARQLLEGHSIFTVDDPEAHCRLGHLAKALGMKEQALGEFSRALSLAPDHHRAREEVRQMKLVDDDIYASIARLRKLIHACPDLPQPYRDLSFCYAEIGEYGLAQQSYQKALEMDARAAPEEPSSGTLPLHVESPPCLAFSDEDIQRFLSLFRGKEGAHAYQWVDAGGRRGFRPRETPLTAEAVRSHLSGEETLGLYLMDENDQVQLAVIDIDIDQKALLEYARDKNRLDELCQLTQRDAADIACICDELHIPVIIEDSGYKGRHLWFFFATPTSAKLARRFLRFLCERAGQPKAGTHREIFPNCDQVKTKGHGPLVKLPLGMHKRTRRGCLFVNRQGDPLPDQMKALHESQPILPKQIEDILLTYAPTRQPEKPGAEASGQVNTLLSGCKVIHYLVNKARETHYLDNAERVTLLYTLGHLGEEGKSFLHQAISHCINYDYEHTERQIRKMKPFPISCPRIRQKHEDFALELGCNCSFKLPPKGYPSPILHVFRDGHTPTVKDNATAGFESGSKGAGSEIGNRLRKYIELKRQLAGVQKSLRRVEGEMTAILEQEEANCVETEFGLLEMRKREDGVEWVIKL